MVGQGANPVLLLNGVSKCYADGRNTPFWVENITLQLSSGDLFRLRGKSGTGKTTVLRIAGLLAQPDAGQVYVCGTCARGAAERDRLRAEHIGIVFQENQLFNHLTVTENLRIADLSPYDRDRYEQLYSQFGINHLADVKAGKLSGGELQRAGICRAIINDPQLLLLDEPTSALDDDATVDVLNVIRLMQQKGVAILLASHDSRLDGIETHSVVLQ